MRVLAGSYSDYSGDILIDGVSERIEAPRRARQLGVALVHQELVLSRNCRSPKTSSSAGRGLPGSLASSTVARPSAVPTRSCGKSRPTF